MVANRTNEPTHLQPAPPPEDKPPERKPEEIAQAMTISVIVQDQNGYEFEIAGAVRGPDVTEYIGAMAKGLLQRNLKPVERNPAANVQVTVEAPAGGGGGGGSSSGGGGEARAIPAESGKPPRCSLHGPMVWREGTNDRGHYEFWGCKERNCKLTYRPPKEG